MSFIKLQQSSSGKLSLHKFVGGTANPNGKAFFLGMGQIPKHGNWGMSFTPTIHSKFKDIAPTASPKYPHKIEIYAPGRISLGKTAELCSLYYDEIITEIRSRGLYLDFGPRTPEEAERELGSIRRHMRRRSH